MDAPLLFMAIAAGFFNLILLPFVIFSSKYAIGSFKVMILAIAFVNQLAFFSGVFTRPSFFLDDYTIIVYDDGPVIQFGPTVSMMATVVSFDSFPTLLLNQLLQFSYRYIALCKFNLRGCLKTRYVILSVVAGPVICFTLVTTLCCLLFYPDEDVWAHTNENILKYLKKDAKSLNGFAIKYWKEENDGSFTIRWADCLGTFLFVLICSVITSAGIFLAVKIHRSLKQTLVSNHSKFIHMTMFHMLIVQSMVPLFLHVPAVAIFFTPLFFPAYDKLNFVTYVVMVAPLLEPIVVVYFLNAGLFKKSIRRFFRRKPSLGSVIAPARSYSGNRHR